MSIIWFGGNIAAESIKGEWELEVLDRVAGLDDLPIDTSDSVVFQVVVAAYVQLMFKILSKRCVYVTMCKIWAWGFWI